MSSLRNTLHRQNLKMGDTLHMVNFNVLIQTLCECELFRSSFLKISSNSMEISLCILTTLGSDMILS